MHTDQPEDLRLPNPLHNGVGETIRLQLVEVRARYVRGNNAPHPPIGLKIERFLLQFELHRSFLLVVLQRILNGHFQSEAVETHARHALFFHQSGDPRLVWRALAADEVATGAAVVAESEIERRKRFGAYHAVVEITVHDPA